MAANDWSERTRMIVTGAVALAINVGLGAWFYHAHGIWQEKDKIHKAKVAEKRGLEDFVKQGDSKALELKQLAERFKAQESKLPDTDQVATFNTDITKIAQQSKTRNLSFVNRPSAASAAGASYTPETWSTRWEGDFMGWCKVMNDIEEQFPRFIAFESLSIQPENSGVVMTGAAHKITVDLVTYRYNKPAGP